MSEIGRGEERAVNLHCLEGDPAPAPLLEHWRSYQSLPPAARTRIWDLLVPAFD